jgi:hypothetical protein
MGDHDNTQYRQRKPRMRKAERPNVGDYAGKYSNRLQESELGHCFQPSVWSKSRRPASACPPSAHLGAPCSSSRATYRADSAVHALQGFVYPIRKLHMPSPSLRPLKRCRRVNLALGERRDRYRLQGRGTASLRSSLARSSAMTSLAGRASFASLSNVRSRSSRIFLVSSFNSSGSCFGLLAIPPSCHRERPVQRISVSGYNYRK